MAKDPVCLVCQKRMELGFMTQTGSLDSIAVPRWCPGEPKASLWSGEAKRSQVNQGLKVVAYRCPECEALRLYAPSSPAQP